MELKPIFGILILTLSAHCEINVNHLINTTQNLYDIERGGHAGGQPHQNLYPQLNTSNHVIQYIPYVNNQSVGGGASFVRPSNNSHHSLDKFLNKTISGMKSGFCIKEVPTVSLLKNNEIPVAGNGSDPSLSRIQVCCDGYQRNAHNFRKCDPICSNGCINGFCSAPEVCVCYPDHVRNYGGFCIPTCPVSCGNGVCNPDNTCFCKKGYKLDPQQKFCVPVCSDGCVNGNCTEPNTCTCYKGFTVSLDGKCSAVCSKGCRHGDCVAPEVCQCKPGYRMINGLCLPECSRGCENGICTAPETCECRGKGWILDETQTKCTATCEKSCLNGICSGPNECKCHNGYVKDFSDPFRCIPNCNPPCENSVCSGPNMCLCNAGYVKDRSIKYKCVKK